MRALLPGRDVSASPGTAWPPPPPPRPALVRQRTAPPGRGLLPPLGWGLLALRFPPDQHLETPHLFRHLRSLFCDFLEWLYRKSWVVMHKLWVEFCPAGIRFRLGGFCGFSCNKDGVFSGGVSSVALTALPSRPCAIEP